MCCNCIRETGTVALWEAEIRLSREVLRGRSLCPIWRVLVCETQKADGYRIYWQYESRTGSDSAEGRWVLLHDQLHGVGSEPTTNPYPEEEMAWVKLEEVE